MSSGVESGGAIAAAVLVPAGITVAAVLGAGWLAWQGGKLLIRANQAANDQIAKKKRQLQEEADHQRRLALAAHNQLVEMCQQLLSKLDEHSATARTIDFGELEQLKGQLRGICQETIPEDVMRLESQTSLGLLKLDQIISKERSLSSLQMEEKSGGLYRDFSLADLMADLKTSIVTMEIHATESSDVHAANPTALERAKLNKKLACVTARIMEALEHVASLSSAGGLPPSSTAWFHSCFNGIDSQINTLYMPSTTNDQLKKGIKRLESLLEQYDMLLPSIESDQKQFAALYQVYAEAAKALGEPIASARSFQSVKELEEKLLFLKKRSEKAQICAAICQKLGPTAYLCYAWDQELRALGYSVHSRNEIAETAKHRPQHARLGENKLPFYQWTKEDLTQLYSMTAECSLQVIVHDDGSVTMQTLSDTENDSTKSVQSTHCSLLAKLHENLRENWFVLYDYQETASPDKIVSTGAWFGSEDSQWKPDQTELITEQRERDSGENRAKHLS